jgi:hypothetical protein
LVAVKKALNPAQFAAELWKREAKGKRRKAKVKKGEFVRYSHKIRQWCCFFHFFLLPFAFLLRFSAGILGNSAENR